MAKRKKRPLEKIFMENGERLFLLLIF